MLAPTKENGAAVFAATIEKGGNAIGMALMPGMLTVSGDDDWVKGFVGALCDYLALDKTVIHSVGSKEEERMELKGFSHKPLLGNNQFSCGRIS